MNLSFNSPQKEIQSQVPPRNRILAGLGGYLLDSWWVVMRFTSGISEATKMGF